MEFFVLGVVCAMVGFVISWATGVDIRALGWCVLTLPFLVILIVGFFRMQTASPADLGRIAAETIESIVTHWVKHLLFSLGTYVAGACIGALVPSRS